MLTERNGVAGKKRASAGRRLRSTTASAVMSRRCREARASDFLLMVRRGDVGDGGDDEDEVAELGAPAEHAGLGAASVDDEDEQKHVKKVCEVGLDQ